MLDCVIRNGEVIDGTGTPRRHADVGIRDGRITAIGKVDEPASREIDADGRVVAPGFVDIHTHYDAQVFWDPAITPSSLHGVTTVVGGNCGFTIAPLEKREADYMMRMLARVEGMPLESLSAGVPWDWQSFGEYLDRVEGTTALNAGFLVGHSALRRVVMGEDAVGKPASAEQVQAMVDLLHQSLAAGGLGFSSSQATTHNDGDGNPVPSRAADRDELVTLAGAVREHPGTTLEFIPTIGAFSDEHKELMTAMSLAADRPLNWNVLVVTSMRPDGPAQQLEASDYASERGAKVLALTVPCVMTLYLNFRSGFIFDALPGWAPTMARPLDAKIKALSDPEERKRLGNAINLPEAGVFRGMLQWENLRIAETYAPENEGLAGKVVGQIAAERGQDAFDVLCDIAVADELRTPIKLPGTGGDEQSWRMREPIWRDPRAVVGASDAGAHLDMTDTFAYATSMLSAVRKHSLMPLEDAVHLITDRQARLYGITGRGRLAEGWHADIVVFDEETIGKGPVHTRFDLPAGAGRLFAEAEGIEHVLVNGTEIVTGTEPTGATPGTLLRSGRDTETVTNAEA
jgi:N-acyl-D-aspartate/D-glutamate deacylase